MRLMSVAAGAAILAGVAATAGAQQLVENKGIDVIPLPVKFELKGGTLAAEKSTPEFRRDPSVPAQGYRLTVTRDGVQVVSSDDDGAFYARQTLRQLTKAGGIPCCEIEDAPKYRYRGVMIDEGRHFFGKEAIKRQLDLMAEHKLNFFHWHLTEDQGWRLEIKSHPELVKWGAKRPASPVRRTWDVEDGVPYGPFYYTQDEIREVLAYARERHITVYPEIEMPGHTRAVLAAHPELMCEGQTMDARTPWTQWGICEDVVCLGNPGTLKLFSDVLSEVCDLFADAPYVHIGGEECTRKHWAKCAKCQALKRRENLKNDDEIQGWFTMQMSKVVHAKGKRLAGWCELSWSGLTPPKDTLLVSGCGGTGAFTAAGGYETVMAPSEYCYFYFNQGLKDDPYDYGWFWAGAVTLGQVYSFFPGYGIPPEHHGKIIGGECHIWSEYTLDPKDLEWKIWPRGLALAEALWTGPDILFGINDFVRRAKLRREELVKRGYNAARIEIEGLPHSQFKER